jgi:hypothetical protein
MNIVEPGIRGVDLLALTPEPTVLALEVKGTLRAAAIPRFSRGRARQMSVEWLNDPANPAMAEWNLEAMDLRWPRGDRLRPRQLACGADVRLRTLQASCRREAAIRAQHVVGVALIAARARSAARSTES